MQVRITARGAKALTLNCKPRHTEGETVEVSEHRARFLVSALYAEPVPADEPEHKPEETTTDPNADERETRDAEADGSDTDEDAPQEPARATAKGVRAWAKDNGVDVPARGAIPSDVIEAYNSAHE